ncbi:50S ribosomal protein L3 [Candidatus Daviesbacteria bacterium RIFCSPHIGHO2_02_FULL_39_12]|uniref:Large ribosomal subunit protein uL3 n=2 Tax=Candidatus Daviesiibacteriota TaxID=1752718 RepID=A0A1F5J9V1_9BACT|nr:MAG: 50S ribosomal protein L3 [Candidatus Daviesbacteria bacterium RIFCSPHIGHO2_02_FULL_39_12]OGE72595.1 MAG: 50S ribosomal protein L3 [Candidatus Daviesbacteria bacterium RIFCSPLOWO2_02_FULL_38_15]
MINALLGIKKNMIATYDARGRRVGATLIQVDPNFVTQVKTADSKDGYEAVQIGMGTKKSVHKPQVGHAKKAGIEKGIRWFKEVKISELSGNLNLQNIAKPTLDNIQPGQEIKLDQVFSIGDAVKVSGISRGRGFQGGVRRHGFAGGPRTHGQSDRHRASGSIGSGTTPGRVYKGKRMAGHMGSNKVSVKNLEVVGLDRSKNLLIVKGGIPGHVNSLVMITKLGRIKGYTPPPEEKPEEEGEGSVVGEENKNESSVVSNQSSDKAEEPKVERNPEGGESNAKS